MGHPYMAIQQRANRKMNGALIETPIRRVTWTDHELEIIAREAFDVLESEGGSISKMEAVRRAQGTVLPVDRHRVIRQERDLNALLPLWAAMREANAAPLKPAQPHPLQDAVMRAVKAQVDVNAIIAEPKARKQLVRWNAEERRKVAAESKRLLNGFADMSKLEAIRKAVEYTLPPERHRTVDAMSHIEWIEDEWKALDEIERATKAEREARERAAEAERHAEQSRRAIEAARTEAEAAKAVDPASLPFETLIEAIGVKVAGTLLRSIGEQLQESIMQRITDALGHITMPAALPEGAARLHAAPRHRKPRVLIVGLLNQQEQDMTKAMGEVLNLDYAKSEHHTTLEDKARNADLVVLMTKFISHQHQRIVQGVNEHVVYRNGGVSELKRWLTQWINGEVLTAAA